MVRFVLTWSWEQADLWRWDDTALMVDTMRGRRRAIEIVPSRPEDRRNDMIFGSVRRS